MAKGTVIPANFGPFKNNKAAWTGTNVISDNLWLDGASAGQSIFGP